MDLEKVNHDEIGVFISSGIGGLRTTGDQHVILLERGPDRILPVHDPDAHPERPALPGLFSMYGKLRGPNFATCSACATSTHAIGEAWRNAIPKWAMLGAITAGGTEATIVPMGIGGFCAMRAMSTRNDDPDPRLAPV